MLCLSSFVFVARWIVHILCFVMCVGILVVVCLCLCGIVVARVGL